MVAWAIADFGGRIPRTGSRNLPNTAAEQAINCDLSSGFIEGLPIPELIIDLSATAGTQRAYRFPDPAGVSADVWLPLPNQYSSVCRSPLANDTEERLYWTNPGGVAGNPGALWNTRARIQAGNAGANAPYALGMIYPDPNVAPTVTSSGGTLGGTITAWTILGGGNSYAVGDTGTIVGGSNDATYSVVTIDGVANTVTMVDAGTTYNSGVVNTVPDGIQPGDGSGMTLQITANNGPILAAVVVNGGIGYNIGDTGFLQSGTQDATYRIVTATGSVLSLAIIDSGTDYEAGTNTTVTSGTQPGGGSGLTLSVTAISAVPEVDRSYLWTYVNQYGEESAPSAPSTVVAGASDGTWTITGLPTSVPTNPTGYNYPPIIGVNLYRTITGATTGGQFYLVASFFYGGTSAGPVENGTLGVGGTGYAVGDTGTIDAGTGDATYTVTGITTGGAVTTFSISYPGTTYPSGTFPTIDAGNQPGSGTGLTIIVTTAGGPVDSVALYAGGSGYAIGDTGNLVGGSGDATYVVTEVASNGAVTAWEMTSGGTAYLSNTYSTADSGNQPGVGNGFAVTVTASGGAPPASYIDSTIDANAVNNTVLYTASFNNPLDGLDGLTALPGGMLVGWTGNTVHFCEPDRPFAWPAAYDQSVQYEIVGFGVWQQSLVVLTAGFPLTGAGNSPSNFVFSQVRVPEPCISRGSIITDLLGVYYASQNGLVMLNYFGMQNQTLSTMTKNIWLTEFNAAEIIACRHRSQYLAILNNGSGTGFLIDYAEQRLGIMNLNTFDSATCVWNDEYTGNAYICAAGKVYLWDSPTTGPLNFRWRSKQFYGQAPTNLAAAQVTLDPDVTTPPPSPNPIPLNNGDTSLELPAGINAVFNLYVGPDGQHLWYTCNLTEPRTIFPLPSGIKAYDWQVEIVSRVGVRGIELASTMQELRGV